MPRLLISAAHKSSGKTTVSIGLAAAFRARGTRVQPFKKGPDYIDPMWLSLAAGRACHNLDPFLMNEREIVSAFQRAAAGAQISLVEGNKGLHDGLDLLGSNSSAALAKTLKAPVILVMDASGMTRGIVPLVLGIQAFDPKIHIAGVILNRVSGSRHEAKLRAALAHYTDVPVVGALQRDPRLQIVERHLGLMPAGEMETASRRVQEIGALMEEAVELDRLLAIAATAPSLPDAPARSVSATAADRVRIGLAHDRAFGFYYAGDLDALRAAGAELVEFDTLRDARLPDVDGLFIGGGFPEMFLRELSANVSLRAEIRAAIEGGLPVYAECGGLMYLARSLTWNGQTGEMVGVLPGDVVMHEKPVGKGYVQLVETGENPWPAAPGKASGAPVWGHEFHYSSLENLAEEGLKFAYSVARGHGIDGRRDGIVVKNLLASYAHLRCLESANWAARFVRFVAQKKQR